MNVVLNVSLILAEVTLTTVLALAAVHFARSSRAAVRHLVLASAFAVLLILPLASLIAPPVQVAMPAAVQAALDPLDADPILPEPSPAGLAAVSVAPQWSWPAWQSLLLAGWIAGIVAFLVPVIAGLWQVRSLRRTAAPSPEGCAVVTTLAAEAGIRRPIDVLVHASLPGPMTCGVMHPAIILPIDTQTWTAEDLQRALVHELEHVRRGDWLSLCLARVVATCYWFHPIVWVAWRRLSLEAERACDDAVLRASEATAYADQLVLLAQRLSTASQPQLAMASRRDLSDRVFAVLDGQRPRGRAGTACVAAATVACAMLVITMSPLRVVSAARAQIPPPQASAPATRATQQRYDAATIKRCEAQENPTGARGTAGGTNATFSPGRFYVPCVTTEQLIYLAYAAYGVTESEGLINDDLGTASNATKIRGGPAWVHSLHEKYSIEATAAGATGRTVLMGSMLRTLLEERFKLRIHRDTEETAMYALTIARSGFKLKPMKEGDCDPDMSAPLELNPVTPRCGVLNMNLVDGKTVWTFGSMTISTLAGRLSSALKVHVVDNTNIKDKFVFRFVFPRDPDPLITETGIFAAVEEQLGLKLEKAKGPRGFIVIDAIERPTPDDAAPIPTRAQGAGR